MLSEVLPNRVDSSHQHLAQLRAAHFERPREGIHQALLGRLFNPANAQEEPDRPNRALAHGLSIRCTPGFKRPCMLCLQILQSVIEPLAHFG